ncbi:MAG TPA: hypothetical protein VEB39_02080 [Sphingomicrobium sp.]|nr:hypothetical protein [Sphingomicrobium sp.]
MSLFKTSALLAVSLSMATSATAAAQSKCVTEAESAAIMAAMMPDLIDGLRKKCSAHLPTNAYLSQRSTELVARYRVLADQRWPTAKLAFGRMTGEPGIADKLPDEFFRPMLGAMVGDALVKDVKPHECEGANRIVESLAPLPPENVAVLIAAIMTLADREGRDSAFPICKA